MFCNNTWHFDRKTLDPIIKNMTEFWPDYEIRYLNAQDYIASKTCILQYCIGDSDPQDARFFGPPGSQSDKRPQNQGFSQYFCLVMERSKYGAGSVQTIIGTDLDPGGPKNLRIRIRSGTLLLSLRKNPISEKYIFLR